MEQHDIRTWFRPTQSGEDQKETKEERRRRLMRENYVRKRAELGKVVVPRRVFASEEEKQAFLKNQRREAYLRKSEGKTRRRNVKHETEEERQEALRKKRHEYYERTKPPTRQKLSDEERIAREKESKAKWHANRSEEKKAADRERQRIWRENRSEEQKERDRANNLAYRQRRKAETLGEWKERTQQFGGLVG